MLLADRDYERRTGFFNLLGSRYSISSPSRILTAFAVVGAVGLFPTGPAHASRITCEDWITLRQRLEAAPHHERVVAEGRTVHGTVVTVMTNERGSFSIVTRSVDGFSCLLAAGEEWGWVADPAEENDGK